MMRGCGSGLVAILAMLAPPAAAQSTDAAIPLGTGRVPGATGSELWSGAPGNRHVRNVITAALLPVLPDPAHANGTAIIVAPGGGFLELAWDREGMLVARALADRGYAAFVLKYRVEPTPPARDAFAAIAVARRAEWIGRPGEALRVATPPYAIADGIAALALVRTRAAAWRIDPSRVGMIGFSAGARTALRVTLDTAPGERPAFLAMLYPPMEAVPVPRDAPPAFVAMARDDPLSGRAGHGLIQSWIDARRRIEFHAFQTGGHGFGLGRPGTTTTGWVDGFTRWLDINGFGRAPR